MKTVMGLCLWLALGLISIFPVRADNAWAEWTDNAVNSNSVTVTFKYDGQPPEWAGVVVLTDGPGGKSKFEEAQQKWSEAARTNRMTALVPPPMPPDVDANAPVRWYPFTTNSLVLDLGPGDGRREIWIGFRRQGESQCQNWDAHHIIVQTSQPVIYITEPLNPFTSQPLMQLKGYCPVPIRGIYYDLLDQDGHVSKAHEQGLVNDQYYDPKLYRFTTNYFTCYDIVLTPGTNTIALRATDDAGNAIRTNFTFVFSTAGVVSGPRLTPEWPTDNAEISGSSFTVRGRSDDPSAQITALIVDPAGSVMRRTAEVERTGRYWIENIPLPAGRTYLTLVANNAAGYTTVMNLSVRQSQYLLAMDPVVPASKLWQAYLTITGTSSYDSAKYAIWVNDVKATTEANGRWHAENVPISPGGVATFDIKAVANDGHDESDEPDPLPTVPIVWGRETNGIQWGAYLSPGDTNHLNRHHFDFYLVNRSGTNMNFQWMRPAAPAGCVWELFDGAGQPVGQSKWGKLTQPVLATGLNWHHLDAKAVEQIDGVLPLVTNVPVRVASMDLEDWFLTEQWGKYCLRSSGQLYQIAADGRLVPMELPPVTTILTIEAQPSETVFYLRRLAAQGAFHWGAATGPLQVGLGYNTESTPAGKGREVVVYLMNGTTNARQDLVLPAPDQQFELSLQDASGNPVSRTELGAQQGKPLSLADQTQPLRPLPIAPKDVALVARFELDAYFKIAAAGTYRLTYQQRLFQIGANGTPENVLLPPVTVPVEIR